MRKNVRNTGSISNSDAEKRRQNWQEANKNTVLNVGDYVKIGRPCKDCSVKEHFWLVITQTNPFKGTVDNDLIHNLGFNDGQEIEFERSEIQRRIENEELFN